MKTTRSAAAALLAGLALTFCSASLRADIAATINVNATTSNNRVRTHAALQDDCSIAVMLLNLHLTDAANVTVNLANFDADASGIRYLLSGGMTLTQTSLNDLGSSFIASLPARSMAVYTIEPAPALPGDFNDDGAVDGLDFLAWQRGDSPTPLSPGDLAERRTRFTASSTAAGAAVPEPATGPPALTTLASWLARPRPANRMRVC